MRIKKFSELLPKAKFILADMNDNMDDKSPVYQKIHREQLIEADQMSGDGSGKQMVNVVNLRISALDFIKENTKVVEIDF